MEQLLGHGSHLSARAVQNGVVPLHKATLHTPAVVVQIKGRPQQCKLFPDTAYIFLPHIHVKLGQKGKHLLLYGGDVAALRIKNMEAVPPCQLPLHGKSHGARLPCAVHIIDIVAVKPRKHPLLEIQLHGASLLPF